jgi:hypothetical protein
MDGITIERADYAFGCELGQGMRSVRFDPGASWPGRACRSSFVASAGGRADEAGWVMTEVVARGGRRRGVVAGVWAAPLDSRERRRCAIRGLVSVSPAGWQHVTVSTAEWRCRAMTLRSLCDAASGGRVDFESWSRQPACVRGLVGVSPVTVRWWRPAGLPRRHPARIF